MVDLGSHETGSIPQQSLGGILLRFLRFGFLAWGGPMAQIAMLERELVEEERWVTPAQFNRAYALYQALPGPEAHELCVYFGTLARGRLGGLLAGLGFMLPGFVLMLALSWFYVAHGITAPGFAAAFAGIQAAVLALIVRAVHKIGGHALTDRYLWIVGIASMAATLAGVHFGITLLLAGAAYAALGLGLRVLAGALGVVLVAVAIFASQSTRPGSIPMGSEGVLAAHADPTVLGVFISGLRTGLLTFGGAYTSIPFLLRDSVDVGGWLTREQFLDGIALGGILPAPLIIFGTFVGYLARGLLGALALTAGIFLPAFGFTMVGHEYFERVTQDPRLHRFLAGVTAGVVGVIAATTVTLAPTCVSDAKTLAVFAAALVVLYLWRSKFAVAVVVGSAAVAGLLFFPSA
jgi:chromate transporter